MPGSWWPKLKRAQQHMVDIRREARCYAESHPYEVVPIRQPGSQRHIRAYRLHITAQPDPMLAMMLGDFVHNLRSALDHIVVACSLPRSTRKNASFPISVENLWERDARRRYVIRDAERRKSFLRAMRGLPDDAKAIIYGCQPYQKPERAASNIFAVMSRLENADKHRELIAVATGIVWPTVYLSARDELDVRPLRDIGPNQFLQDGAQLRFTIAGHIDSPVHDEVDVQLRGTAAVGIEIAQGLRGKKEPTAFNLRRTMLIGLSTVRAVLTVMEPFVVRP